MSNKLTVSQLDRLSNERRANQYDVDVLSDILDQLIDIVRNHLDDHDSEDVAQEMERVERQERE